MIKTAKNRLLFLILLLIILAAALYFYPSQKTESSAVGKQYRVEKIEQNDIGNFYKVTDQLYRSQQPDAKGFKLIEKMGIKTIVNLRSAHSDRDMLGGSKMGYEEIPFNPLNPEKDQIVQFLKIVTDPNKQPVLVHCQHGSDRTGMMCAVYRVVVCGWPKEEALDEMVNGPFGFHSIWKNIVAYFNNLDFSYIKTQAGLSAGSELPDITANK